VNGSTINPHHQLAPGKKENEMNRNTYEFSRWIDNFIAGKQHKNERLDKCRWDVIVHHMNDKLRERVHTELAPCSEAEFLARYMELHLAKYGAEFEIN
jgi:hypothetical protein